MGHRPHTPYTVPTRRFLILKSLTLGLLILNPTRSSPLPCCPLVSSRMHRVSGAARLSPRELPLITPELSCGYQLVTSWAYLYDDVRTDGIGI